MAITWVLPQIYPVSLSQKDFGRPESRQFPNHSPGPVLVVNSGSWVSNGRRVDRTFKVPQGRADIPFGGARMSANRVLLVDDDEVVRTTLTGVLEQSGFTITTAG
jgi:hypothetical protein